MATINIDKEANTIYILLENDDILIHNETNVNLKTCPKGMFIAQGKATIIKGDK